MEALAYTDSYANYEEWVGIEYDLEVEFFDWVQIPSSAWLNLLAVGVVVSAISAAAPALAISVDTPSGRCLNARYGPGLQYGVHTCVPEGTALLPVVNRQGEWLQLSSGRWVYGPYTRPASNTVPGTGGTARQVATPSGRCLNARTGPGMEFRSELCVRNGAALLPVVNSQGNWVQLSSGRWVYGPYTRAIGTAVTPGMPSGGRVLRLGARGAAVRGLQEDLIALKYSVGSSGADGIFGPATRDAVVRFQRANGLVVDGVVGAQTMGKLIGESGTSSPPSTSGGRLLRLGSRGDAVRGLQEDLIALKYSVGSSGADGVFGPATRDAVIRFQRANKLAADGIVGPQTMKVLIGE